MEVCRREDKYFGCGNLFYGREERERERSCVGNRARTMRREQRSGQTGRNARREIVFWGREKRASWYPRRKKGHKGGFAFIGPSLFTTHAPLPSIFPSFLPSRPISKLLRSFQTRTVFNNAHDSRRNAPLFSEIKKFFTHRNYFNALVRRVYLLHV